MEPEFSSIMELNFKMGLQILEKNVSEKIIVFHRYIYNYNVFDSSQMHLFEEYN